MKDNSTAQLERCPFCGGHACLFQDDGDRFVECSECGNRTPLMLSRAAAIAKWNTRAPVSQDAAQLVERLRTIEAALTDVGADIRELRLADAHAARTGWEGRWDRALHAVCQHENRIKTLLTKGVATEAADLIEALTRVQPSTGLDMGAEHE